MVPSFETILTPPTSGESLGFKDDPLCSGTCHSAEEPLFQLGTAPLAKASPVRRPVDIN
jgi:hypothetical protein